MSSGFWSSAGSGLLGGILSLGGNLATSAINSHRAWKYTARAMQLQDSLNRAYTRDSYGIMREGLEKAGYNPLLALGSGANSAIYSGAGINSDSDAGDQAVNSALSARENAETVKGLKLQNKGVELTNKHQELENKKLEAELNTSPKNIVSEIINGDKNGTVSKLSNAYSKIRSKAQSVGINLPDLQGNSAKGSTEYRIKLHDGKPYVQKGVPRSVVNKFSGSNKSSALSVLDSLPRNPHIGTFKHPEGKKVKHYNNRPPKSFPSGM